MTEPMFIKPSAGLTVGEIVALTGASLRDNGPLDRRITSVALPDRAGPGDLIVFDNVKLAADLAATQAGVCLTSPQLAAHVPARIVVLHCDEPYRAFVAVARSLFSGSEQQPSSLYQTTGVSAGAHVHPSARVENGVTIDPGVVIGPRAEIGARTLIAAGASIGPAVRIGRDCNIGAGATLANALVGDRVIIHSGARIGHGSFDFVPGPKGLQKIPQLGRVIIQDDVEIGANTAIDRGGVGDTVIGEGSKIDNLVQIGHNVTIGRHCILAGQVGISGSVTIADYAVIGGQASIADRVVIGEGAIVTAGSGVVHEIGAGERWGGYPATTAREWMRGVARLRRMLRQSKGPDGEKE